MSVKLPYKLIATVVLVASVTTGCHLGTGQNVAVKPDSGMMGASAETTKAIAAAKTAIKQAKMLDWIWRDTEKFLKKAEAAAKKGDNAKAMKLANKSRQQADDAVNQYYLEKAKTMSSDLNGSNMSTNQQADYSQANMDIGAAKGKAAYDLLSRLNAELNNKMSSYKVNKGDSLWSISGQSAVYGNSYQWPLIYKANSGTIKDADLIYAGQDLSINMNPNAADVSAAISYAKSRGAWSVGDAETSDMAYLGGSLRVK